MNFLQFQLFTFYRIFEIGMKTQNQNIPQRSLTANPHKPKNILKSHKIKKQNECGLRSLTNASLAPANKRTYFCDQETMYETIQKLKYQNMGLKQVMKIQQTQIQHFKEQEMKLCANEPDRESRKVLEINLRLKRRVEELQAECRNLKKSWKHTKTKQLQICNTTYLAEIKKLTAKVRATEAVYHSKNIEQLNNIIEKEYFLGLDNEELRTTLIHKNDELQKHEKTIKRLKCTLCVRNRELDHIKQELEQVNQRNNLKNRNANDFVPKNEYLTKKKQCLHLSERVQILEARVSQCETKNQCLQQQNIENLNRETNRRKQLMIAYQKLKKEFIAYSHPNLKLQKMSEQVQNFGLDKSLTNNELRNVKNPLVVTQQHIKPIIDQIIFSLQSNGIQNEAAIQLLLTISQQSNDSNLTEGETSIHEIMCALARYPFAVESHKKREILARYCVEDIIDESSFVRTHVPVCSRYIGSVLKRIIGNYSILTKEEIVEQCITAEKFLEKHQHHITTKLESKQIVSNQPELQISSTSLQSNHKITVRYAYEDIIDYIFQQNQLNKFTCQFIRCTTFKFNKTHIQLNQLIEHFKLNRIEIEKQNNQGQIYPFLTQNACETSNYDLKPENKPINSQLNENKDGIDAK